MNTSPTMNQVSQGESSGSGSLLVYPAKRRRGRPRKDRGANSAPPGFRHETHHPPQIADRTGGTNSMVGQAVCGVIEATFDGGYIITVRAANSPTNFRGAVFKQGHLVPVTPENDIAPHMPTILRADNTHLPPGNQGPVQTTATVVPRKRKREPPQTPKTALSAFPVGVRGTVVPVVLEPVNLLNGSNPKSTDSSRPGMIAFGDKGVQGAEPLATLPPNQSVSAFHQTPPGSEPADKKQHKEDASETGNMKQVGSTDDANDSSGASDTQTDSSKEALEPPALNQESRDVSRPISTDFFANNCVPKAMFNFGTGRMTQLLQAVQENRTDKRAQRGECPQVEFRVG